MEKIPGKTIYDLCCQGFFHNLEIVIEFIKQLLLALHFCHQKGYAHKAICPEHIMVVQLEKKHSILVKLIGFGHAHRIGAPIVANSIGQPSIFTAPERNNDQYVDKQDIWGCGVILLELLSGERHFNGFS